MANAHIDEAILIQYADDPSSVQDRRSIEEHIEACVECWSVVDDHGIDTSLGDEETWYAKEEIAVGRRRREARVLADRVAAEDDEALRLLGRIVKNQYRFEYANLLRKRRFYTGGVVRLLCKTANEQSDGRPLYAQALAETAYVMAEALPDDYYPRGGIYKLRGNAWLEYSTACRYLGQFDRGYHALEKATRAYKKLRDPGMELARVDLSRATLLWDQQRYEEALRSVRAAADQFEARRQTERYFDAKQTEAVILYRMGDVDAALATYRRAFDHADAVDNVEMKAGAARNLGVAYRDAGDLGLASQFLLIALRLYEDLQKPAMVVRTRWAIGSVSLAAGNFQDASRRLPGLSAELAALGMIHDAARAKLGSAEALLMLGRYDEVQEMCTSLVKFFREKNMLTGALTAAAYLKEASAKRQLTRHDIEHVRDYLTELGKQPDLPFIPPRSKAN